MALELLMFILKISLQQLECNNDKAKIIETIPEDLHSPITYPVAVIKDSKNIDAAKAFEDFLFSTEAQTVFEKYGYNKIQ